MTDSPGESASITRQVTVYALPLATASIGGPYREGDTIALSASGGTAYVWSGPSGFGSTSQNPTISSASTSNAGTHHRNSDQRRWLYQSGVDNGCHPGERAPRAGAVVTELLEDMPTDVTLLGTDPDGDVLMYRMVTQPAYGVISGFNAATGTLTYLPNPNDHGPDALSYEVYDPSGACAQGILQIFLFLGGGGGGTLEDRKLILNEIAWAGQESGTGSDWIELRNLGTNTISLEGWLIRWRRKLPQNSMQRIWHVVPLAGIVAGPS